MSQRGGKQKRCQNIQNKRKVKAEHTEVGGIYLTVNSVGFEGYVEEKEMSKNNRQRSHSVRLQGRGGYLEKPHPWVCLTFSQKTVFNLTLVFTIWEVGNAL